MSLGTIVLVLTLIAGFGGAIGGAYAFNAPWWACLLIGGIGLIVGGVSSLLVGGLAGSLAAKQDESRKGFAAFIINVFLPFVAVLVVATCTVTGSIFFTTKWWPERAKEPRAFGFEESL